MIAQLHNIDRCFFIFILHPILSHGTDINQISKRHLKQMTTLDMSSCIYYTGDDLYAEIFEQDRQALDHFAEQELYIEEILTEQDLYIEEYQAEMDKQLRLNERGLEMDLDYILEDPSTHFITNK